MHVFFVYIEDTLSLQWEILPYVITSMGNLTIRCVFTRLCSFRLFRYSTTLLISTSKRMKKKWLD